MISIKPEVGKGSPISGKELSDMGKKAAEDAEMARSYGPFTSMPKSNIALALEDIQRELRAQRKMLERLLEIKDQN